MSCSGKISQSSYSKAISTETNYLGRSQWSGDVGLSGSIDEFRVWNGELSAKSVVANFNAGPNYIILETDLPTFSPVHKPSQEPSVLPSKAPLSPSPAPTSYPTSSPPPSLTPTRLSPAPTSYPTSTLVPANQRATLNHRYSFSNAVTDSIGGAHGTTVGGNVKILNTRGYGRAVFNGDSGSAVQLPARILEPTAGSGATAFSIELWANTSSTDTYSGYCPRLFQFGTAGTNDDSVGINRNPCWPGVGHIHAISPGATD